MENIKDILKGLQERFSSPLIFSFLLSWIIFNWEVTVALLWYDVSSIRMEGSTLIDFIRSKNNWTDSFCYPLSFAVLYTLGSPVVKALISAFNTEISKRSENWNLKISRGAKVPIEKYFALRENLEKRSIVLEDAISKESSTRTELEAFKTDLLKARNEQNNLNTEISNLRTVVDNLHRSDILNGPWIRTVHRAVGNQQVENIQIHNGRVTVTENGHKVDKYNIQHFMYDSNSNEIHFVLHQILKDGAIAPSFIAFNALRFEHQQLVGNEYNSEGTTSVTYKKPTSRLSLEED